MTNVKEHKCETASVARYVSVSRLRFNEKKDSFQYVSESLVMNYTPEEREIGKQNYQDAVGVSRRAFLKTAAAAPALGAFYFGYKQLTGNPLKVGFIGTGDEGAVLMTQHPPD